MVAYVLKVRPPGMGGGPTPGRRPPFLPAAGRPPRPDTTQDLGLIELGRDLPWPHRGGPVVDLGGRVIGVVDGRRVGNSCNLAVPARTVRQFLDRPVVEFTPPAINRQGMNEPVEFAARVSASWPQARPPAVDVELVLGGSGQLERRLPMRLDGGLYRVKAVPVPPADGEWTILLGVRYGDGWVVGLARDVTFNVGPEAVKLSELHSLALGPVASAALVGVERPVGRTVEGPLRGLDTLAVRLAGQTLDLKLAPAAEIVVKERSWQPYVKWAVVVRESGREVARVNESRTLRLAERESWEFIREPGR